MNSEFTVFINGPLLTVSFSPTFMWVGMQHISNTSCQSVTCLVLNPLREYLQTRQQDFFAQHWCWHRAAPRSDSLCSQTHSEKEKITKAMTCANVAFSRVSSPFNFQSAHEDERRKKCAWILVTIPLMEFTNFLRSDSWGNEQLGFSRINQKSVAGPVKKILVDSLIPMSHMHERKKWDGSRACFFC